jgi:hypothetical protein
MTLKDAIGVSALFGVICSALGFFGGWVFEPFWSHLQWVFFPAGLLPWWGGNASSVMLLLLITANISIFVIAGVILCSLRRR